MKRIVHGALAAAALTLTSSPVAAAQPEEFAEISVQSAEQGVDLSVTYQVRVVGKDSRRPANDASVTVSAVGPDGTSAEPVTLNARDTDGGYSGLQHYPAPGRWAIRLSVDSPSGVLEVTQEVGNPPATTTTGPISTSTVPPASTSTVPLSVTADEEQPGEEITSGSFVFLIAMLVVIAGFVVVLRKGRRNQPPTTKANEG